MTKSRKIVGIIAGILLTPILVAALALIVINAVDWDKHRPFVKGLIERFSDFEVENIEGIRVHLLTSAEAGVDRIKLRQTNESSGLGDLQSAQAYLKLKVFPLIFHKTLIVQSLVLDGANIHLRVAKSKPDEEKKPEAAIKLADLPSIFVNSASITDFKLAYLGANKNKDPFHLNIIHAGITAPSNDLPSMLSAEGKAADLPFEVLGAFGSFDAFRDEKAAYPARLTAKIADHNLEARGTLRLAQGESHFDIDLAGPGLKRLKQIFKLNIGDIPNYTLSFAFDKKPNIMRFEEIKLLLGKTHVAGKIGLDFSKPRTQVQADLVSPKLFAADIKGLFQTDKNNKEPDEVPKPEGQYFSNIPIHADGMKIIDADISLQIKDFEGEKAGTAIKSLIARGKLNGGKLVVDPLNFGVADGTIGGDLSFDARKPDIQVKIQLGARRVNLDTLLGPIATEIPVFKLKPSDMAKGMLSGHMDLSMHGKTPMDLAKTVSGPIQLAVEDGKLSATVLEAFGLDITETVGDWIIGHPMKKMECGLTWFEAKEGIYSTKAFLIATSDSNITAKGQLDLPSNNADFLLSIHPRDFSIGSVRTPIYIKGPLNGIKVGLEKKDLILKGGAALILGAINPALALLPLVEPGLGKDGPCKKYAAELKTVVAKAKEDVSTKDLKTTKDVSR